MPSRRASAASSAFALVIDVTAPAVAIALARDTGSSAADGVTSDGSILLSGEPGAAASLFGGGALLGSAVLDAGASGGGTGFATIGSSTLADGAQFLTATATDAAGNAGSAGLRFTLDTRIAVTAALARDTELPDDLVTSDPTLAGTTDAGASVTILEGGAALGSVTAGADGAWSFLPQGLALGEHTLIAAATDLASS